MRNFVERDFPCLVERIYDAALDPSRWQVALNEIAACCGGAQGIMYLFDREQGRQSWSLHAPCDPAYLASYAAHFGAINPYPVGSFLQLETGHVESSTIAISKDAVEETEFFNDWMRPQQIPADHFGAALFKSDDQIVCLAIAPNASVYERNRHRYERQLTMLLPQRSCAATRSPRSHVIPECRETRCAISFHRYSSRPARTVRPS